MQLCAVINDSMKFIISCWCNADSLINAPRGARSVILYMKIDINTPSKSYKHSDDANVWARNYIWGFVCKNNTQKRIIQLCRHNY
jgi:hypothetical protein